MNATTAPGNMPWLDILRCPDDHALLQWTAAATAATDLTGSLTCTRCAQRFPVQDGLLLGGPDKATDAERIQEMAARDALAATYESDESNREEDAVPAFLAAMQPQANDCVIDLGCGVGMITRRYLAQVQRVIAIDFSLQSLHHFRQQLPAELRAKVLLVHADITRPPVARGVFDKVATSEVLHHLPTPELRQASLKLIADLLAPQGTFTCSVYNWSLYKQRRARRGLSDDSYKQGLHESQISYYNFDADEFLHMLQVAGLRTTLRRGLMVAIPGSGHLGTFGKFLRQRLAATRLGIKLAHLLLTHGQRA